MSATDGSPTKTGWKRRSSAASFSMCRAVLVERRRADCPQLAAREHRLEQVPRADRALGGARADDRVELVDEQDDLALARGDLLEHGLEPLLELAAVLRARDERADIERPDALPLEPLGHVAGDDPLRQPLGDRGLADPGLADEHGVVLRTAGEHLDRAPDLLVAPDHRIELPLLGERGEVAPVLLERLVRALRVLGRHALAAADLLQRREQRVARNELEREQEMLDGDVLVLERARLDERVVQGLAEPCGRLGLRRAAADRGLLREPRLRLAAHRSRIRPGAPDERPRQLLVEQRDREVVGGHLGIAGTACELLGARDRLAALDRQLRKVHLAPQDLVAGGCDGR